jgi:hypothetical protein
MPPRLFTPEKVTRIVQTAREPRLSAFPLDQLGERLEECADQFIHERLWQRRIQPSRAVKQFQAIEKTAQRLLKLIESPEPITGALRWSAERHGERIAGYPDLPPEPFTVDGETALSYRGEEKLHQAVENIKLLAAWAAEQKYKANRRVNPKPARYGGDAPMRQLISNLASLWKDACKRPAGASTNQWTGEIGGPFMRFVQAFLDVLRESLDADDLQLDPDLPAKLSISPEVIRAILRRLVKST